MSSDFNTLVSSLSEEQQAVIEAHLLRVVKRTTEDTQQRMKMVKELRAGPVRLEAVEFEGKITYTMCFNNDVMAHMGEQAAKLFCDFVSDEFGAHPVAAPSPADEPF